MPKVKKCPHCGNVLFCRACGQRVTPSFVRGPRKKVLATYLAEAEISALKEMARESGLSLSEFVEKNIIEKLDGKEKKNGTSKRRGAVGD